MINNSLHSFVIPFQITYIITHDSSCYVPPHCVCLVHQFRSNMSVLLCFVSPFSLTVLLFPISITVLCFKSVAPNLYCLLWICFQSCLFFFVILVYTQLFVLTISTPSFQQLLCQDMHLHLDPLNLDAERLTIVIEYMHSLTEAKSLSNAEDPTEVWATQDWDR